MRAILSTWLLLVLGGCLRSPGYQCASADQCTLDGVAGRCEPNHHCSIADGACASGFKWGPTAPAAGSCVADTAPDARPDDAAPPTVNECLVQAAIPATASTCAASVCAQDARCCTREWSDQCVQRVEQVCGRSCSQRLATIGDGLVRVMAWNGAAFVPSWSHAVGPGTDYAAIAWGDYDQDLDPDLVTCVSHDVAQIWNNGGGGCGEAFCAVASAPVGECETIDWVDFDHDGDLDVAFGGASTGGLWWNDGQLFPATASDAFEGAFNTDLDWADLDGDGFLDLARAVYEAPASIDRVTASATPGLATLTHLWSDPPAANALRHDRATFGDVDRDGDLDLLITGDTFTHVWRNTSTTGGFTTALTVPDDALADGGPASTLADADEDGDLDILQVAEGGTVVMHRNRHAEGTEGFTATALWASARLYGTGRIAVGDVDGDHHLDLVVGVEPRTVTDPTTYTTATAVFLARPGTPWAFGTATDTASWEDPDRRLVRDLALAPAW